MKNIEIKAPLDDRPGTEKKLADIGARHEWTRKQVDTFFTVPSGWLKLRRMDGRPAELISYRRSVKDSAPRESDYDIFRLENAEELSSILERSLGSPGKVEKDRSLWLYRETRIHLDQVLGLGDFLELETVLENISAEEGKAQSEEVIHRLGLEKELFIAIPYLEMLRQE